VVDLVTEVAPSTSAERNESIFAASLSYEVHVSRFSATGTRRAPKVISWSELRSVILHFSRLWMMALMESSVPSDAAAMEVDRQERSRLFHERGLQSDFIDSFSGMETLREFTFPHQGKNVS